MNYECDTSLIFEGECFIFKKKTTWADAFNFPPCSWNTNWVNFGCFLLVTALCWSMGKRDDLNCSPRSSPKCNFMLLLLSLQEVKETLLHYHTITVWYFSWKVWLQFKVWDVQMSYIHWPVVCWFSGCLTNHDINERCLKRNK